MNKNIMNQSGKKVKYPGKAPVNKALLQKYSKGAGVSMRNQKMKRVNKTLRKRIKLKEEKIQKSAEAAARSELFLTENYGCLEADPGETTMRYTQTEIAQNVDITSATKFFTLYLDYGPYSMRYMKNGRHLLLGGRKGHVAAMDWVTKKLACEINVMESVHDVAWLHVETMFAAAQKDWVYVYDNKGVELHCLQKMGWVNRLEFLPYHFLLAGGSRDGSLSWIDVSIGKYVATYQTHLGYIHAMTQNPSNAVLCIGNAKGVVSMWSPNVRQPLAKMLCHRQAIRACTVHPSGTYMATSATDRTLCVWDVRNLAGPVHSAVLRSTAQYLSYSQRGLLGIGMGDIVEVYRESSDKIIPYLRHSTNGYVTDMQFCPYEDVLGVATTKTFTSLIVPGSGEANYDALESNPFQTKRQRREAEVKALLDKIQPEFITLEPNAIAEVDVPSLQDKVNAKKALLHVKPKQLDFKPRRSKAKGRGGTAKVVKSKNIQKEQHRRNTIEMLRQAQEEIAVKKTEGPRKNFGALNRFLPKQNRQNNR